MGLMAAFKMMSDSSPSAFHTNRDNDRIFEVRWPQFPENLRASLCYRAKDFSIALCKSAMSHVTTLIAIP